MFIKVGMVAIVPNYHIEAPRCKPIKIKAYRMKCVEKYKIILTNKNYSKRTIDTYVHYLQKALDVLEKNPYHITLKDIEDYLINQVYSSVSQQNQIIGSLKLFAKYILNKKDVHLDKIERPRKVTKLPKVIDGDSLRDKILNVENLKHKAILALGFSCALRVSEVINLKMSCIDRKRMIIFIENSKGRKDRVVKMSELVLSILDAYYKEFKPKTYLFNGQYGDRYSAGSCNKLMKKYIGENTSFHLLRHSGATVLHEKGLDIMVLSKLLGHKNVKTTQIYTHISNRRIENIVAPL